VADLKTLDTTSAHQDVAVYMEGHEGHRGNVLAHVWNAKLGQLLSVLARMERRFSGADRRQTSFEVVGVEKRNPTIVVLHPVPSAKHYDPLPALDWSMLQIQAVATGGTVDDRIDAETADMLAGLARPIQKDGYKRFWMNGYAEAVQFDESFRLRAESVAFNRRAVVNRPWFKGTSRGEIIGELRAVDDEDGNRTFIVNPKVGPRRVLCRFPEDRRGQMGAYLFKTVRVTGALHFEADSPHPVSVDMTNIEDIAPVAAHLLDIRGSYSDVARFERFDLAI
jgi:hypothetical protein